MRSINQSAGFSDLGIRKPKPRNRRQAADEAGGGDASRHLSFRPSFDQGGLARIFMEVILGWKAINDAYFHECPVCPSSLVQFYRRADNTWTLCKPNNGKPLLF